VMTYVYGAIAALALAVATGLYGFHVGDKAGSNRIQVAWDKDKAAITAAAAHAQAEDAVRLQSAQARNEELTNANSALQASVAASTANGADLALRLRHALSAPAHSCTVLAAGGESEPFGASGVPAAASGVDQALAAYDAACQRDAARLNALSAEVKPQL